MLCIWIVEIWIWHTVPGISIHPLGQYFEETPLAAITAASPLGYVSVGFAHLDPDSVAHCPWKNSPSSVKLDGDCWWKALKKDSQTDWGVGFYWVILTDLRLVFEPLKCSFGFILMLFVLLQTGIGFLLWLPFIRLHPAWKACPQHDSTTTRLRCKDGVLRVMRSVRLGFPEICALCQGQNV